MRADETTDPALTPLASAFADDPDFAELIELFVSELPDRLGKIESAFDAHDFEQLERLAHQLKGAAGGYGFDVITDTARCLEQLARDEAGLGSVKTELEQLRRLCVRATLSTDS